MSWLEERHGGKVESIEVESYHTSYKYMMPRFFMVFEDGEKRIMTYDLCAGPDETPYLLILCELQPLCVIISTETYDFNVKGVRATFLALV